MTNDCYRFSVRDDTEFRCDDSGDAGFNFSPITFAALAMKKNQNITSDDVLNIDFEYLPYSKRIANGATEYYPDVNEDGFGGSGEVHSNYRWTKTADEITIAIPLTEGGGGLHLITLYGHDGTDYTNYRFKISGCAFTSDASISEIIDEIAARKAAPPSEPEYAEFNEYSTMYVVIYGDCEFQLVTAG